MITPDGVLRRAIAGVVRRTARATVPARYPASSSISSWWAAARPASPRRSTEHPRVSARSGSMRSTLGGQAGTSSRIENYAGFPNGISGEDLTARSAAQAMRLGARLNAPCEVVGPARRGRLPRRRARATAARSRPGRSSSPPARATGACPSRTLSASRAPASTTRRRTSRRASAPAAPVLVVGGGNSAGQAAIFLARTDCAVTIAIRRDGLSQTMSQYLIERIEADPRIELITGVEVERLAGGRAPRAGHARGRPRRASGRAALRGTVLLHRRASRRPAGWRGACSSTRTASSSPTAISRRR